MKICDFASLLPCLSCSFWAYTSEKEFVPKFPLCYSVSPLRPQPKGQTIRIRYYSNFPLIPSQNFITISYHCKPTAGYRTESRPSKYSTGVQELPCPSVQRSESKPCRRVTLWALGRPKSSHWSVPVLFLCHIQWSCPLCIAGTIFTDTPATTETTHGASLLCSGETAGVRSCFLPLVFIVNVLSPLLSQENRRWRAGLGAKPGSQTHLSQGSCGKEALKDRPPNEKALAPQPTWELGSGTKQ